MSDAASRRGSPLHDTVREIVPRGVSLAAGTIAENEPPAHSEEEAAFARASAARLRDFRAGRRYARAALEALGIPGRALPSARDGGPVWPRGAVGSISHAAGLCVAIAAPATLYAGVGIDLEAERAVGDDVLYEVVSDAREYAAALASCDPRDREVVPALLFVAKESAFKACRGLVTPPETFREIRVTFAVREFRATVDGRPFAGRVARVDGVAAAFAAPVPA
jgi:4'-phosphopantetheinyl transferase EntD